MRRHPIYLKWRFPLSLLLLFLVVPQTRGQTRALSFTGGSAQFVSGHTVGWGFTVSNSVVVRSLGWFDAGAPGLAQSHDVGIFTFPDSGTGTLLVSGTVDPSSPLTNSYHFTSISPTTLDTGN